MRLIFLKAYQGRDGIPRRPGNTVDVRDDIAAKLIRNKIAKPAPEPPKVETAEKPQPTRNAARRTSRAKPRK